MTAKFDSKKEARKLFCEADKKAITITRDALMSFALMCIDLVFAELISLNKIFTSSRREIADGAVKAIYGTQAAARSDYALLSKTFDHIYSYMWSRVNFEEATYIKLRIIEENDLIFTHRFFFGSSFKGLNIAPIRSKIAHELKSTYGVRISQTVLSAMILDAMWSEGSWYPLQQFRCDCSIYSWIERIGRQRIIKKLEEEGHIKTAKDNRGKDISLDDTKAMVDKEQFKADTNSLREFFDINLSADEIQDKSMEILNSISRSMEWNDDDRYVWQQRYFCNTPSKTVAEAIGRTNSWVDNRFHRLQEEFCEKIRKWALKEKWISEADLRDIEHHLAKKREENRKKRAQARKNRA